MMYFAKYVSKIDTILRKTRFGQGLYVLHVLQFPKYVRNINTIDRELDLGKINFQIQRIGYSCELQVTQGTPIFCSCTYGAKAFQYADLLK